MSDLRMITTNKKPSIHAGFESGKLQLIIVTKDCSNINYRVSKLLELSNCSKYQILVYCHGNSSVENFHVIKPLKNPFNIFKKFGLSIIAQKINQLIYFPSPLILFNVKVEKEIESFIKKNSFSKIVLITIAPPHDLQFVGLNLKKKFDQIKWINDLQDLWSYDEYYVNRVPPHKRKRLLKAEKQILKIADHTIVTNEEAEKILIKKYNIDPNRVGTIYHPFENFNFNNNNLSLRVNLENRILKLVFVGSLFKDPKVPGEMLLNALNRFVLKYNWKIEFKLIGDNIKNHRLSFDERLTIIQVEKLSHSEAFVKAYESDFMVLLLGDVPNAKVIMHGKYSHYLSLYKPILAFVPIDSFISGSISKTNSGYVIPLENNVEDELFSVLTTIIRLGLKIPNYTEIEKFSKKVFLDKWVKIIEQ